MSIVKTPDADPTCTSSFEVQTVTASSGSVTVSFDADYPSKPTVVATAVDSSEAGVTIDSSATYDTDECTLLCEADVDINVCVIG